MLLAGTLLQNRYRVIALLGQGGMGAVYQAQDLRLGQVVALKENIGGDPRQFQQEAVLLANLHHPNLPRVIDHFVEPSGTQYLVMDFIEGEDLESRLARQGALPEAQVLAWFEQILDAIAYMHSRGVIHRDIKPANIKITSTGQAVLVDFGIAKVYQPGRPTVTGAKAATPGFASPEQYRCGTDARSDIYSLGATLYALVTGQVPPDALALAGRSAMLVPPRTLNSVLSAQTEQVILRAMAVLPQQRFQSVEEMRRALKVASLLPTVSVPLSVPSFRKAAGQPWEQLPILVLLTGIIAILVVAIGVLALVWDRISNFEVVRVSTTTPTIAVTLAPTVAPTTVLIYTRTATPTVTGVRAVTVFPTIHTPQLPTVKSGSFFDDFSGYRVLSTPIGYTQYGTPNIVPTVISFWGEGNSFQRLRFPPYTSESTWKWLIKDEFKWTNATASVKLNFQSSSDGAGLVLGWVDINNFVAILANPFWDEIVLWEFADGTLRRAAGTGRHVVPIETNRDYWLRAISSASESGERRIQVLWSTDGTNYTSKFTVSNLVNLTGRAGVGTYQFLSDVLFDDLSIEGSP